MVKVIFRLPPQVCNYFSFWKFLICVSCFTDFWNFTVFRLSRTTPVLHPIIPHRGQSPIKQTLTYQQTAAEQKEQQH